MGNQKFSFYKRLKSFTYAFNGLKTLFKEEHNARIHLAAAICVVIAGFVFELTTLEWIAIIFVIGFVFTAEIINTSIENIADFISPAKHEKIKNIKDLAAAGVLVSAVTAVIIGVVIFLPRIIILF